MTFVRWTITLEKSLVILLLVQAVGRSQAIHRPPTDTESSRQVQVVVDGQGAMSPRAGIQSDDVPLKIHAKFSYLERRIACPEGDLAARWYKQAKAEIHAGQRLQTPSLAADHLGIAFQRVTGRSMIYSFQGSPLYQEERDLLEIPAPSILLERLLPQDPVEVTGTWSLNDEDVANLFNLDAVSQQSLKAEFLRLEKGMAICQFAGSITGMSEQVLSKHEIEAKFNVDIETQTVSWLAMIVRETRTESALRPGFSMTAKVRVRREVAANPAELATDQVSGLQTRTQEPQIAFLPTNREYELLHDPKWIVTQDRREKTTLEFIDQSASVAQCSVTPLPDLPIGKTVSLSDFRQDIESAIGNNLHQLVDTRESSDEHLSLIRVVATGRAQTVPIQWIYYHTTSPEGRRAVVVFTLKQEDAEKFGTTDLELIKGLRFREETGTPVATGTPEDAKETATLSDPNSSTAR
ncbi:MAG: hypothetical protein O2931_06760 [Planctomycetota bacterium]|nr:hypothetical protein [Planctomycetota bacterium]MDA1178480.1 hypothetical protein [Planctomycetota bacterium]